MNDDFARFVLDDAASAEPARYPTAYYDEDGDFVEFIASPEHFRARRLDGLVTIYRGEESGEIVGAQFKGIRAIVERARKIPQFEVIVRDGAVRMDYLHLVVARRLEACDEPSPGFRREYIGDIEGLWKLLTETGRETMVRLPDAWGAAASAS